ncbi:MAG: hypothetical protein CVU64_12490, partial [Deltaproteobacteria bacterium HGW-Deltaproteobacteria-21]
MGLSGRRGGHCAYRVSCHCGLCVLHQEEAGMMLETISSLLMVTGALFMLVAAVGILRFPDIYMRASASAKASTLGVGLSLAGMAFHFAVLEITVRSVAIIIFVVITTPIAAHLISRAAYTS